MTTEAAEGPDQPALMAERRGQYPQGEAGEAASVTAVKESAHEETADVAGSFVLHEPPWYGTVCPVVWEDGGSNPASYPIKRCPHRHDRTVTFEQFRFRLLLGRLGQQARQIRLFHRRSPGDGKGQWNFMAGIHDQMQTIAEPGLDPGPGLAVLVSPPDLVFSPIGVRVRGFPVCFPRRPAEWLESAFPSTPRCLPKSGRASISQRRRVSTIALTSPWRGRGLNPQRPSNAGLRRSSRIRAAMEGCWNTTPATSARHIASTGSAPMSNITRLPVDSLSLRPAQCPWETYNP